tara:strand:+ start:849 stop:1097 length:249 start_codon:yes stop_codon:yes gene_type:complete
MMKWNGGSNVPNLKMTKYKILQDTMADGKKVHAGDVVELLEHEGNALIGYQKAEVYVPVSKPKKADRSVGLKKSETKEVKKR